jgi:ribosomal protein S18 acetylase RimI-like enzyme
MPELSFHEIRDIQDDLLLPWLDLYEQAFPPNEKVYVSDHLAALKERSLNKANDKCLLAALEDAAVLVGMARYDITGEPAIGYLIYLAVTEEKRNVGIGGRFYGEIVRRLQETHPSIKAVVMEVERPDQAHSEESRAYAERRIRFYLRQGAFLVGGINYLQEVDNQPPVPMHVMVHPFVAMEPEEAYHLAGGLLTLTRTDNQLDLIGLAD